MRAKKSLGQHFLKSEKALSQIVDAGDIHADLPAQAGDLVLEIGPGTGALTEKLLERAGKVVAIEKDRELISFLKEKFLKEIASRKLELIEADILRFDISSNLELRTYKLIANIPYYITGAIIEQFLSAAHQPERMVLLVQKEVAERIIARDNRESVLSIAVKVYGTPRIVAKVPAGAFAPAPKVDSAILSIENISRDFFQHVAEQRFFTLLKFVFGKKRKQLGGSLADFLNDKEKAAAVLNACKLDPKLRPENLSKEDWKRLALALSAQ